MSKCLDLRAAAHADITSSRSRWVDPKGATVLRDRLWSTSRDVGGSVVGMWLCLDATWMAMGITRQMDDLECMYCDKSSVAVS